MSAAVLDIDLQGREVWPVAEVLAARNIPYLFATGYGDVGTGGAPVIEKPFGPKKLAAVLQTLVHGSPDDAT